MDVKTRPAFGSLLREWRQRRRVSQLDLAVAADVSSRHLSFIETGRSKPSRRMILHLAEHLDVPLRDRNGLLVAAGYAPVYRESDLEGEEMKTVREAIRRVLSSHEPYPALVADRLWNLVAANDSALMLADGVAPHLLAPPANVLRLAVHPEGMAPRIANFEEWSGHLLHRLHRQALLTADEEARALHEELAAYPGVSTEAVAEGDPSYAVALPLRLRTPDGELAFLSTVATFGTAVDITLAELTIETFLPADERTAEVLGRRAGA